ncbi:hypothetical protein GGI24_002808, partial [Coemansia furcata]
NAEELAILSEATIQVRGQPLIPKCVIQYKDSYAYILVTRLAITSFTKRTKDIAEVLSPYGKIVDIIFERQKRTIHDHVKVILDRMNDKSIPCCLMISSMEAVLSGRKVEVFCNYCRTSGHYKDKCPIHPGNKKHVASIEISTDETTPASNLPNNSASSSRSIPKKSRARNTKTVKSTKSAQPTASNKRARHDGNPDPRSPIAQTAKEVPTPTSAASTALPFISGAANFGPGKSITRPLHSHSGSSVSLSSLAALQTVPISAHQPAVTSSNQTGKYPAATSLMENADSDIAMNSCENQSPAVTSTSVAPTAVTPSISNASARDSTDTAASSVLYPAHQTRSHTKAQANVVMDVTGNERLSVSEQRSSSGGSPQ